MLYDLQQNRIYTLQRLNPPLFFDIATTKARRIALEKRRIVKEWESLKAKGVSAESAKRAEKITLKRIKEAKKEMERARQSQYANLQGLIEKAAQSVPKVIKPSVPVINNRDIQAAKLKSEAKAISGSDIAHLRELQIQEEKERASESKKDLSFFAAVIKKREE